MFLVKKVSELGINPDFYLNIYDWISIWQTISAISKKLFNSAVIFLLVIGNFLTRKIITFSILQIFSLWLTFPTKYIHSQMKHSFGVTIKKWPSKNILVLSFSSLTTENHQEYEQENYSYCVTNLSSNHFFNFLISYEHIKNDLIELLH